MGRTQSAFVSPSKYPPPRHRHDRACEIRLRAERKAAQLLATMEKLKGRPKKACPEGRLSDLGVSRDQSSNWQKLGDILQADFDAALAAACQ
jgi:hypothetical protein